jgi:hypothetical protein
MLLLYEIDNKVCELATFCSLRQQWTGTSIWFDDVGISAFHSCVADLWQSLYEWRPLLSECFGVPSRECRILNIKFLVKLGKSGSEIREMLVQVYGDNAMRKTEVYVGDTFFGGKGKCHWRKKDHDGRQRAELKKTLQKFLKLCVKVVGSLSGT